MAETDSAPGAAPAPPAAPDPFRLLIAGGGTGGHLFPGLAIAEAFRRRVAHCEVRFAGSAYGIESRAVPERGFHLYRLPVRGLYRVPLRRKLWVLAMLPVALLKALAILLCYRPHLVIGVGGYASGPMLAAAVLLRRRTAIQEQNAAPGLTNRLLGPYVNRAFVPVPGMETHFARVEVVGTPVRREILALRDRETPDRSVPLVFVVGGSQGARAINRAFTEALPDLAAWGGELEILHQTGALDLDWVGGAYGNCAIPHRVTSFVEDMADALARSRVVISRAGASAVSELVAARRAAILVPIPGTSGDHQRRNAQRLVDAGAAILLEQAELSGPSLARTLLELLQSPQRLAGMEAATDALFPGDSAALIVESCLDLVGNR